MKKIGTKIIIYVTIFTLIFTPISISNTYNNYKRASASSEVAIMGLELILIYLIGLAAQKYDVNIPMPSNDIDRDNMYKYVMSKNDLFANAMLNENQWWNVETGENYQQYLANGGVWSDIDPKEWVTYDDYLKVRSHNLDNIADGLAEYHQVPVLANSIDYSAYGSIINIMGRLKANNIFISKEELLNCGIQEYQYHLIIKKRYSSNVLDTITYIVCTNMPMFLYDTYKSNYGMVSRYIGFCFNENEKENSDIKVLSLSFDDSIHDWVVGNNDYNTYIWKPSSDKFDTPDTEEDINKAILYANYLICHVKPTYISTSSTKFKDYVRNSDLSYKTFLQTKYGGGVMDIDDNEEITLFPGAIVWQGGESVPIEDRWKYITDIDNLGTTDKVLENLKNIDDFAREQTGEKVISKQIVDVREYIDDIDLEKYQTAIDIQGDIQLDFDNTYTEVIPTDVDIPQNILNGLLFVAFVFGEMWGNLGSYNFILTFSATIGAIALLIGLGKQINDRNTSSSKTSKKTKKGG